MKKIFITLFAATFFLSVIAQDNKKKTTAAKPVEKERTQAEKDKKIVITKEQRDVKNKGKAASAKINSPE